MVCDWKERKKEREKERKKERKKKERKKERKREMEGRSQSVSVLLSSICEMKFASHICRSTLSWS